MVIANATTTSGPPLLLLGLSLENIKRLMAGKPIYISRSTHGDGVPENIAIAICFGQTEDSIIQELTRLGAIGPDTVQHKT